MTLKPSIKDFLKKYGTNTTTNFDLIKIAKELNIKPFYYVMRDEMDKLPSPSSQTIYVCTNLHSSKQKGIHHSCFTLNINPEKNYFFDSYGLPPTKEVEAITKHGTASFFQIQEPGTKYCGQLDMYVLYHLSRDVPFIDIILSLL